MNKKKKILLLAVITIALTSGYMWGIPAIVNLPAHKVAIEQKIYEKSGFRVDVGHINLSMGAFPSVWVKSDRVSVINKDESNALLIENPKVKLKLLPLLFKKVEVTSFMASKEDINLVLTKDKEFFLGDYPIKFQNKDRKFTFEKGALNVGPYNIKVDDRLNNITAGLQGEYIQDVQYIRDKKFKLATIGNINIGDKSTSYFVDVDLTLPIKRMSGNKLKLEAEINNFDLSGISDYINILTDGKIKELGGVLSFNAHTHLGKFGVEEVNASINSNGLRIVGEDEPSSIIFQDKLDINVNFETTDRGVKFKKSSILAKDVNVFVAGSLSESGKRVPAMDLTVEVKPSRLEQICKLIPGLHNLLPDMDLYYLKKYFFYGNGDCKIRFVGHGDRPEVFGSAKMSDTYVIKRIPNTSKGADVDMKFKGKVMHLNVFVPTGKTETVTLDGDIKIDGSKYSELKIKNNGFINMDYAQDVVNPLHQIFKFKLGPVPIMDIKGLGEIDVYSAGKKVDPHLWGSFKFKDVTASFNDVKHLELRNASGVVEFHDTEIPFKITSGTINGHKTDISGKCNVMGDIKVDAKTYGQDIPAILKVINSSKDMADVQKVVKPFTNPSGVADIALTIYGNAKDAEQVKFNKDLFAKGAVTFHNASTVLQNTFLPLQKINGVVNFDKKSSDYDVNGYVRNSQIHVKGTADDNIMDLTASSDKIPVIDIMDMFQPESVLPFKKDIGLINVSLTGKYKGIADSENLDYDKIIVDGKILPNINSSNFIKVKDGNYKIRQGVLSTDTLNGLFDNNPFTLSFSGSDIYKKMKLKDAQFSFKNFNIASLDDMKHQLDLPSNVKFLIKDFQDFRGTIDINGHMKDGKLWSDTNLSNLSFKYAPSDGLVRILSGNANIRNNILYLGNVNTNFSSMPLFINGNIANIDSDNPNMNLYINGKPNQMFFDRFFNVNSVYPIKVKGDLNFKSKINGTLDNLHTVSTLNVHEDSSIYFMGATVEGAPTGEVISDEVKTNPVYVIADATIHPNSLKLNSLKYRQLISSQNKKQTAQNLLEASGDISLLKDNVLGFKNLRVKTYEPTSAKLFNIIFKKPTIKQGNFTANLNINGTSLSPVVFGNLNFSGVDVPLFDSAMKDIDVQFDKDYIYVNSKGVVLTNDFNLYIKALNKTITPYVIEDFQLKTDTLDLNSVVEKFNDFDTEKLKNRKVSNSDVIFTPDQVILKNAQINADKILIKKASATDFSTKINISKEHILNVEDFSFNLANGTVNGKFSTDLMSKDTKGSVFVDGADARIISEDFFDMPGQMYGDISGSVNLSCKGDSSVDCLKSLSGDGSFDVVDGRMPKLGSLEYLLKAANLVTGGITAVSINGVVDLITPLKTGNFDSIKGDIKLENGIAKDIEVFSQGKDLNMYMSGSYNLNNLVADMEIYGSLSKNFSTILGKIGNMSLNRLFNKIPGVSINEITPSSSSKINKIPGFDKNNVLRVFKAEIYGDINGSNYVKSFKWIKH